MIRILYLLYLVWGLALGSNFPTDFGLAPPAGCTVWEDGNMLCGDASYFMPLWVGQVMLAVLVASIVALLLAHYLSWRLHTLRYHAVLAKAIQGISESLESIDCTLDSLSTYVSNLDDSVDTLWKDIEKMPDNLDSICRILEEIADK